MLVYFQRFGKNLIQRKSLRHESPTLKKKIFSLATPLCFYNCGNLKMHLFYTFVQPKISLNLHQISKCYFIRSIFYHCMNRFIEPPIKHHEQNVAMYKMNIQVFRNMLNKRLSRHCTKNGAFYYGFHHFLCSEFC